MNHKSHARRASRLEVLMWQKQRALRMHNQLIDKPARRENWRNWRIKVRTLFLFLITALIVLSVLSIETALAGPMCIDGVEFVECSETQTCRFAEMATAACAAEFRKAHWQSRDIPFTKDLRRIEEHRSVSPIRCALCGN